MPDTRTPIEAPPCPELVERVARALYQHWVDENLDAEFCSWDQLGDKQSWLDRAIAAIEATRPTAATDDVVKELYGVALCTLDYFESPERSQGQLETLVDALRSTLTKAAKIGGDA